MKFVKEKNRALTDLCFVVTVTFLLSSVSLLVNFLPRFYNFVTAYYGSYVTEIIINVTFLLLVGLVWLTHRRWVTASHNVNELEIAIANISPDALLVIDADRTILQCNRAVKIMLGYEAEEILGQKTDIFYDGRYIESHKPEINGRLKRDGFDGGFFRGKKKNGENINLEIISSKLRQSGGAVLLLRGIDEQKKAEEALKEANQKLVEVAKAASVAQLAAGVAHEVKNPLAIILQGIDFVSGRFNIEDKEAMMVLKGMGDAVERADYIVRELLDLARPRQVILEPHRLEAVIESSLLLIKHYLDQRGAEVVKEYAGNLPNVNSDRGKLIHVWVNLLTNAADAMLKGGTITIKTYLKILTQPGGRVGRRVSDVFKVGDQVAVVEIQDSGEGIPEEVLEKIFEPFFTTKRGSGGTGLGLSVAKNIIDLHRGTIDIANKEDGGARVTVVLPLSK